LFYRQKTNTFIRTFADIGYIINKDIYKDQIFNATGAVFLKALARTPKSLEKLSGEIAGIFSGVDPQRIKMTSSRFLPNWKKTGLLFPARRKTNLIKKTSAFLMLHRRIRRMFYIQ